jgi:hypothetical protein
MASIERGAEALDAYCQPSNATDIPTHFPPPKK